MRIAWWNRRARVGLKAGDGGDFCSYVYGKRGYMEGKAQEFGRGYGIVDDGQQVMNIGLGKIDILVCNYLHEMNLGTQHFPFIPSL